MLKEAWQCKQLLGTFPVEIPSESTPGLVYIVTVDPFANRSELHECNCPSYQYRRRCKHQRQAHRRICGWNELDGPEVPTEEDIEDLACPRCGGPMIKGIWEVEQ